MPSETWGCVDLRADEMPLIARLGKGRVRGSEAETAVLRRWKLAGLFAFARMPGGAADGGECSPTITQWLIALTLSL